MRQKEKLEQVRKESNRVPQCDINTDTSDVGHHRVPPTHMADENVVCTDGAVRTHGANSKRDSRSVSDVGNTGDSFQQQASKETKHPLKKANILSKIFFCWMFSFFRKGYKRPLVHDDLYDVLPEDSSAVLVGKLDREWKKELRKAKCTGKPPSLRRAIVRSLGCTYMVLGIPAFLEEVLFKVLQPILVSRLVLFFSTDLVSTRDAYLYAAGIGICALGTLMTHHVAFFGATRTGMKVRVACSGLVYRKALRLSHLALGETTVGQLVNILSNDVNRFDLAFMFLHYLWIAPVQLTIITVLIWREIGISCLAGLPILILLAPFQGYMAKLFSHFRSKTALLSDTRIRIMNEIISGIRVIKIYAWEHPFGQLLAEARRKEIEKILYASYLRASTLAFFFVAPLIITFCTFIVYALLGNPVIPSKVYVVVPLFYVARLPASLFVPFAIMNGSEGLVSIRRIRKFLMMEENNSTTSKPANDKVLTVAFKGSAIQLDQLHITAETDLETTNEETPGKDNEITEDVAQENTPESPTPETAFLSRANEKTTDNVSSRDEQETAGDTSEVAVAEHGIVVANLSGSWTKDASNTVLEDISFRVDPGELLAVIGPVGCGKSSLLMALLGELPTMTGTGCVSAQIGYTTQQPWIINGSLKDNILFGKPYRSSKYQQTIKQCALTRDIELLPDGDQTLVGERGVTLSGGQRARVSLARAVYSEADVYLLDDPLSAVDPAVGRHLFDKCIMSYLEDKARILVTHQLQFLDKADKILILKQGKVADYGTYHELQQHGIDFAALLKKKSKDGDYDHELDKSSSLQRQISIMSKASICSSMVDFEVEAPVNIVSEETATGTISSGVYLRYLKAGANAVILTVWAILIFGAQGVFALSDWWLSQWAYTEELHLAAQNLTSEDDVMIIYDDRARFIRPYAIMCAVTVIATFIRSFMFFYILVTAAKTLHNKMFRSAIRAPMQFFDRNPVGRVLNRFAKDIGYIDELLPATFTDFVQISVMTLSVVVFISIFNPFCLIFTLPLLVVFVFTRSYFLASSRDVKRLEANARSPVFSHLSATLTGLSTVRAFKAQQRFTADFDHYQDEHTRGWFMFLATTRWFGVALDAFSVLFICGVSFTSIIAVNVLDLNSGIIGLSLTYATNLMGAFQWGVRQSAEVENQMTSVERVCQYIDIKSEAPLETNVKPPPEWPKYGVITFEDVSLRYDDNGPLVLQKIYCCIRSKEKVGVVGRTGAGKSSLMTIIMRLAEPTGTIMIDGVDTAKIGLHDLRKKVSFIPQDPVLFSGTLRKNLDPFNNHEDADIWRALEEVELKPVIEELPDKLEAILTEGGTNFSVGQRQLLCLARAILRKNKILIVDEATANVDIRTDRLIQATIRQRFQHCTVLTIAHRLNTIMDSDRVLMLDAGRLIEFDEPYILLQKEDGLFAKMVQETGKAEAAKLRQVAEEKYTQRNPTDPYGFFSLEQQLSSPLVSPRRNISIETSL